MAAEELTTIVHYAGTDLYVAISPSGHAITLENSDHQRNSAPTPIELLLMALGGCTGFDIVSIMRKREKVTSYRVEVRGRRRETEPRGFTHIEVKHVVSGQNISPKALAQAIELSEAKYCSVASTLRPAAEIKSSYEIIEEAAGAAS